MFTRFRVGLAGVALVGLAGCMAISAPKKIVVQAPTSESASRRHAPAEPAVAPCDPAELPQPTERLPLAVLDFQTGENMSADAGRALADLARDAIQQTGHFILVDRERIAEILGERDFAAAVQCDTASCLIEYGRLLGARKMMHGRISRLGEMYVLAVGLTDVKTGAQVSRSASLEGVEESAYVMPELVCHLLRSAGASEP